MASLHDIEAEQSVLGGMLTNRGLAEELRLSLRSEDFHTKSNSLIFEAALALDEAGEEINLLSLHTRLERMGKAFEVGGPAYLGQIGRRTLSKAGALAQAAKVRELSARRAAVRIGHEIVAAAEDMQEEVSSLASVASQIESIAVGPNAAARTVLPSTHADAYLEEVFAMADRGDLMGVQTGLRMLDHLTGGIVPGEMCVLGARPGIGKTTFAGNIAAHLASAGIPVGFFSGEMKAFRLYDRFFAFGAEVDAQKWRAGAFDRVDRDKLAKFRAQFKTWPLYMQEAMRLTPAMIRAISRRWVRQNGCKLIIVDYLQRITPDRRDKMREREVSEMSAAFKQMALELNVAVLLLAQLNREGEQEKEITLRHLRESGSIEQDADQVWFLGPKSQSMHHKQAFQVVCSVAKGRASRTGKFPIIFHPQFLKFTDAPREASI